MYHILLKLYSVFSLQLHIFLFQIQKRDIIITLQSFIRGLTLLRQERNDRLTQCLQNPKI